MQLLLAARRFTGFRSENHVYQYNAISAWSSALDASPKGKVSGDDAVGEARDAAYKVFKASYFCLNFPYLSDCLRSMYTICRKA